MKLNEFITETIKHVIDGIENANTYAKTKGSKISGDNLSIMKGDGTIFYDTETGETIGKIDFDIAITVKEEDQSNAGIGIFVSSFFGGIQGQTTSENSTVNRIKFFVPFHYPKSK